MLIRLLKYKANICPTLIFSRRKTTSGETKPCDKNRASFGRLQNACWAVFPKLPPRLHPPTPNRQKKPIPPDTLNRGRFPNRHHRAAKKQPRLTPKTLTAPPTAATGPHRYNPPYLKAQLSMVKIRYLTQKPPCAAIPLGLFSESTSHQPPG